MSDALRLGPKVRELRRRLGITQTRLARDLGVSPSYLNLIEHDHRPLPAPLLVKLTVVLGVDISEFAEDATDALRQPLTHALADPLFESLNLTNTDVRDLVRRHPAMARALITLYRNHQSVLQAMRALAGRVWDETGVTDMDEGHLPSEEISDLIQRRNNFFPELESMAEDLWREHRLSMDRRHAGLVGILEREHGVKVRIARGTEDLGVVRRFDKDARVLHISEIVSPRSRHFHLAHQLGLLTLDGISDQILLEEHLTDSRSHALGRMVLAAYFAGAMLMPYAMFHEAAEDVRYDVDVLASRFRASFEQVCHRLTSLHRPGSYGIPFHFLKVDTAGNVSKRFSASGIRFAKFSGGCPRWNVNTAFLTPGNVSIQVSRTTDNRTYFCIARTVIKKHGGFHAPRTVHAIGLGCDVKYADRLVYSDGVDLKNEDAVVPIGTTCRLCERLDCEQRAFPSLTRPVEYNEDVRRISFYATSHPEGPADE